MDWGRPVSVLNASPVRAAVISLARNASARPLVVNDSPNLCPATTQRTRGLRPLRVSICQNCTSKLVTRCPRRWRRAIR